MRFLAITFFCIFLVKGTSWGATPVATALKLSGLVEARHSAKLPYKLLHAGSPLEEGGTVRTGRDGWAMLRLADGSTLILSNSTELELTYLKFAKRRKDGILSLLGGKLRATIVNLAGEQTDMRIKSRTAVAGVKGTEFLMLTKGAANVFFGNEGSIAVSGDGKEMSYLAPLTMTQTTRGYAPLEPVKVEPGTPLDEIYSTFNGVTASQPPDNWLDGDNLPNIIARWNINYSRYLVDRGDFRQALHVLLLAIDLAELDEIRADALLERGTVQGRFMRNPAAALVDYGQILTDMADLPQAEGALYYAAQADYDLGYLDEAEEKLREYLSKYPAGRHLDSARTLLRQIGRDNTPIREYRDRAPANMPSRSPNPDPLKRDDRVR